MENYFCSVSVGEALKHDLTCCCQDWCHVKERGVTYRGGAPMAILLTEFVISSGHFGLAAGKVRAIWLIELIFRFKT